ncbi:MAG: pimeloyl-ACP methyl ester carboxylesterase/DNA-binding CsgD family transcriptional regulator [Cryomorphaceae bacterium]|jgi:pimeloyl-ACP methyl ester carboxylesterase/DNA-binding CsgD family transcriptional regulator
MHQAAVWFSLYLVCINFLYTQTAQSTTRSLPCYFMPGDSTESDNVLEAVYDLALNPNSLETFTELWEQFLQSHDLGEVGQEEIQDMLEKHFERSFQLLEKIGRVGKTDSDSLQQFVDDRNSPSIAINNQGRIVAINAEAMTLFGADSDSLDIVALVHEDSQATLRHSVDELTKTDSATPTLVLLRNRLPALMLLQHMADSEIIIADISGSSWDHRISKTLRAMYGLTARECEIASMLYQGLTIKEISTQQHRSLETVRKHAKSLMSKTETHSQPKLMRLLTSLNFSHAGEHKPMWMNSQCANHTIKLRDGRTIAYYDAGRKNAKPIFVLHGIIHDPELPPSVHKLLLENDYRIIGMSRAWFGESSPRANSNDILEDAASDLKQLMDALDINKATLLACMAGSIHAYVFTALNPDRVTRIINLAGMVPIVSDEQIESMPRSLRAVARTARYFPKLFPTLIRTGVALIDSGNIRKIFDTAYRNSPLDFAAVQDPEIFQRLSSGYRFAVHNGYSAYTYECISIMQDKSKYAAKVTCPIDYIHGVQDGLTSIESVRKLCQSNPQANLIEVEQGGHLLVFTQAKKVSGHLSALLKV